MSESGQDQEKQTIVPNLFPLRKESVLAAFRDLSPAENPSVAQEAVNEEMRIFRETNPYVFNYFADFAQDMRNRKVAEELIDQVSWGVMVGHRALREEAKFKGGVLPTFTSEFIEDYHRKDVERISAMSYEKITVQQAAIQLGNLELVKFERWEPESRKIVREKLGLQSDWRPEQDGRYLGIIDLYLLFKEGCSDPKNFQNKSVD